MSEEYTEKKEEKKEEKQEKRKEQVKEKKEEKPKEKKNFGQWYDKNYKLLLFISIALLALGILFLIFYAISTGDIMNKDITLTGGTLITLYTDQDYDLTEVETTLTTQLGTEVIIRRLEEPYSGKQLAITIETRTELDIAKGAVEDFFGFTLNEENSSIEMTGTSLSQSFYNELIRAVILAFVFMSIVVFILFRKVIPSLAVIQAALFDIIFALVLSNIFGIRMSTAGIAALLMLIGYSVDTDIMLTTRVLKRKEGTINSRLKGAMKTGLTMTLTSIIVVLIAYFIVQATLLRQMFLIISFGLVADLISTWFGNASILKWYMEKRK